MGYESFDCNLNLQQNTQNEVRLLGYCLLVLRSLKCDFRCNVIFG